MAAGIDCTGDEYYMNFFLSRKILVPTSSYKLKAINVLSLKTSWSCIILSRTLSVEEFLQSDMKFHRKL